MFRVQCQCGAKLKLPPKSLGRAVACPKCGSGLRPVSGGGTAGELDCRLIVTAGPILVGQQFLLGGQEAIAVGKTDDKPMCLLGTQVSRNHCRLVPAGSGSWKIQDTKSTNGVFVNGKRVAEATLGDGDVVKIGEFELKFVGAETPQDDMYALADMEAAAPEDPEAPAPTASTGAGAAVATVTAVKCPSCSRAFPAGSKICVECGIDLKTGRALQTTRDINEDEMADKAAQIIPWVSWVIPLGLFPIASEAFGTHKPRVTWAITAITVVASLLFLPIVYGFAEPEPWQRNLMLWSGNREQATELARTLSTEWQAQAKEVRAARKQAEEARQQQAEKVRKQVEWVVGPARPVQQAPQRLTPEQLAEAQAQEAAAMDEQAPEAEPSIQEKISPSGVGFRWYQLFTHALLHSGLLHLGGNLVFLLVFGLRVNELVGNFKMTLLYPLLAAAAGVMDYLGRAHGALTPMIGASGAIMGLAGMYLVFFPTQRVHMAFWLRIRFWWGHKLFRMRGFWLLLLWVGINDVLFMALGMEDGTAHWAHIGGFVTGMVVAIALLVSRLVNARGGDALSMMLGRRAWVLVGRPR